LGSQGHTGVVRDGRGVFLLSLIAVCAVAAVDLAVGEDTVLIELLLVGPVIAAFGATPGHTAIVALFAVAVAIPLSITTGDFGSSDELIRLAAVGLVSGLAVGIARLRSDRERDAARLAVQYGVARVLAEAQSLASAGSDLMQAIGEPMDWDVAHLWEVRGEALRHTSTWMRDGFEAPEFEEATRRLAFGHGFGLPGSVWESGLPAWFTNVLESDQFTRVDGARAVGLRGALAFPIRADGKCVAVIELFSREAREPDPDLLVLTDALGTLIGEFVEGVAAAEAVRQSEARKTAVFASSLDAIITIDHHGRVVEFNRAAEQMFGRTAEDVVGQELAELVIPPGLRERHRAALARFSATGKGTLLGRRVELTGMRADGTEFPVELAINVVAGADPPMFTGTVRDITHRKRAEEEREEWLRLEQLARLDATQARDQLQAILSGVADAVTAQAPDGRLMFANEAALELLGFESFEELQSAPGDWIRDRFEILDEDGNPMPTEDLPGRRALAGDGDLSEAVVRFRLRATGEERWSAVKATPILDEDGFVTMAINVIEDITTHKRAERAQRFLADSSALLGESLEPAEVLGQVATLAVPEVADWVAVHMPGETGIELVALAHRDPEMVKQAAALDRQMPTRADAPRGVANVLRTGKSELYPDIPRLVPETEDERQRAEHVRSFGMRSALVVPMVARGKTLGALTLATDQSGRRFDRHDLELAEELARRCGTAVDNARLFSERAYIARTLQQSLLPAELPDIPGIEAAARFRPTGQGNEVGGDFYDLFESGGRGWTVVMGDVCGKGPDAAAITALARYTLRAAAMRERLPSRSLALLNEAMLRQRSDRRFCTVAYAYLEPMAQGARIGFASGGHPLPLLLRADGSVQAIGEPGSLLGVLPDPSFEDRSLSLAPGDALVFYTDGVIEGRGTNGALDEDGLAHLVAACAGDGADAIAARVEDAAVAAQDGSPRDDIAVLVLRVAP
jgi:PAS domain S-box-containing protein